MDNKDTFHTFGYNGGFIHTCHNRTKNCVEVMVQRYEGDKAVSAPSLFAAKLRITKYAKRMGK